MVTQHFHLFDTAIGTCALIWEGACFIGAQLPERDEETARRRLARRFPEAVEAPAEGIVAEAVAGIRALFTGEKRDLSHLPMALESVSEFNRKVYEVALSIPPGETLTYGEVAQRIGDPGAARAVGVALGQNPWPIIVPCHRVEVDREELALDQVRLLRLAQADGDVGLAHRQVEFLIGEDELDPDVGVEIHEFGQARGQPVPAETARRRDLELARGVLAGLGELRTGALQPLRHLARGAPEQLALLSQDEAARMPVEERCAQLPLERPDLPADRRLTQAQNIASLGEAA
ncbi:Methylated-DNA--protein-cysteine methyltransferase [Bosea thiooxidans]